MQNVAEGYTAEILNCDYNMSPLDANFFLVLLKENLKEVLAELEKGNVR